MSSERIGYTISSGSLITSGITAGNIVGTSVSVTNMISTSQTTGTLVASSGITTGNINFTGSLYQNGALYSPSITRVVCSRYASSNYTYSSRYLFDTSYNSQNDSGIFSYSNGIFTNTSGSTLVVAVSYTLTTNLGAGNSFYILLNGGGYFGGTFMQSLQGGNAVVNGTATGIIMGNGHTLQINTPTSGQTVYGGNNAYNNMNNIQIVVL